MLSDLRYRLRALFGRAAADRELDEELRAHLGRTEAKLAAAGVPPEEARRRARWELGGVEQVKEACRQARGVGWFEAVGRDLRLAARSGRRQPLWAAVVILTLALGIGANTAIFSVVNAVLLRPLAYPRSGRLVFVDAEGPAHAGLGAGGASFGDFADWRSAARAFIGMAAFGAHQLTLTGRGQPAAVNVAGVTPNLFAVLESTALVGRTLAASDAGRGAAPVAVISEALWRSRFGGDRRELGRAIVLDHRPYTLVGVMPTAFRFPPGTTVAEDVWMPLAQDPLWAGFIANPRRHFLPVVARLRPGASLVEAQAEMNTLSARLSRQFPAADAGWSAHVLPLKQAAVGDRARALWFLLAAVGLLLLLACANVANLLLARGLERRRETALRLALGASRSQIAGQALAESALLGAAGCAAGIALAAAFLPALRAWLPATLPRTAGVALAGPVLAFAVALALVATVLFGVWPALAATAEAPQAALGGGAARTTEHRGHARARAGLVVAQVALAMAVLAGAGLLLHSLAALLAVNPGFAPQQLVRADVSLPRFQYRTPAQWADFARELLPRLQAAPGLAETALAVPLPLVSQQVTLPFSVYGEAPAPSGAGPTADYVAASPGYFHVMHIPLRAGRSFARNDNAMSAPVTIVSVAMARRYFAGRDPIGQRLSIGFPPTPPVLRRIVGVVGDVRGDSLAEAPTPTIYVPFAQAPFWGGELVTRTRLSPTAAAAEMRRVVAQMDAQLPLTAVTSFPAALSANLAAPRFRTVLLSLFAALALLLAALGLYGVISFAAARRTRELGIRLALGARPHDLTRMILGQGARLALGGVAVGVALAAVLASSVRSLLFGVAPLDPATFVGVPALLFAVALAASYLPARRALRADPLRALRHE